MKDLITELLEYFDNTPKNQIEKDWNDIHESFSYGVEMQDFLSDRQMGHANEPSVPETKVYSTIPETFVTDDNLHMAA